MRGIQYLTDNGETSAIQSGANRSPADVIDLTEGGKTSMIANDPEFLAAKYDTSVTVLVSDTPGLTDEGIPVDGLTVGNAANINVQIDLADPGNDFLTLTHEFVHVGQLMGGQTGDLSEFEAYLKEGQAGGFSR